MNVTCVNDTEISERAVFVILGETIVLWFGDDEQVDITNYKLTDLGQNNVLG